MNPYPEDSISLDFVEVIRMVFQHVLDHQEMQYMVNYIYHFLYDLKIQTNDC
jgi:hypothetical protein